MATDDELDRLRARTAAQSWDAHHDQRQRLLNGRTIPPRRVQRDGHIPVTSRLVWERDGEERVDSYAERWTSELVRIEPVGHDHRWAHIWAHICVWIPAQDVRRR